MNFVTRLSLRILTMSVVFSVLLTLIILIVFLNILEMTMFTIFSVFLGGVYNI
jgi:short subunit fatty acids transporter